MRATLLLALLVAPMLAGIAPPVGAAEEHPSAPQSTFPNTSDPTDRTGADDDPGDSDDSAPVEEYSDDSDASEANDHFTDIADSKAQGFGGNQSDDSRSTGNRDTWPTSGTTGGTLWADSDGGTNDTNGGTNFTSDTAATGMEGSNATDSSAASSGAVPDDAPLAGRGSANQTAVDSSSATSIAVPDTLVYAPTDPTNTSDSTSGIGSAQDTFDTNTLAGSGAGNASTGPLHVSETLASGSGASRASDDSDATEGDLPVGTLEDDPDSADTLDNVQTLNLTVPSSVTVGEPFTVWVGVSGEPASVAAAGGSCFLEVWAHKANLDPGSSESTDSGHWVELTGGEVDLPAGWNWEYSVATGWTEGAAGPSSPRPKQITVLTGESDHNAYAVKQECEELDSTNSDPVWVTNIVDRRDWLVHTPEINSVSAATSQEVVSGKIRMTIDNKTYVDESYTINEFIVDYYRTDTNTWVNDSWTGAADRNSFYLTAGIGTKQSNNTGDGFDWTLDFSGLLASIPYGERQYVDRFGIRVNVTEDTGTQGTIDSTAADDGSTMVTGRVEVLRREWITHAVEARGIPNGTGQDFIELETRVTLDVDTAIDETFSMEGEAQVFWGNNNTWSAVKGATASAVASSIPDGNILDGTNDTSDWVWINVSGLLDGVANAQHVTKYRVRAYTSEADGNRHTYAEDGSTIRSAWVVVERKEWITHTAELNSVDLSTGDAEITGRLRIALDADSLVTETFSGVQVHAQMYDLQRGEWVAGQDFTKGLSDGRFTIEADEDTTADASHAAGTGALFNISVPVPAELYSNVSKWRVWAEFTEGTDNRAFEAENGDTIVTDYIVVDRKEWINHTARLDDVYTSVTGDPADMESRFEFWVESDVDSPLSQQFNFTVHVQGQSVGDSSWTGDVWTSSPASVTITDTGSGSSDTVSNVYNSTQLGTNLSLPADPDYKAWRVYVTVEEWKNRHNGVAEDGASFQTGYVVVNRKEWIQHTLNMSVAAESADSFLDVSVWMDLDQNGPIDEAYDFSVQVDAYNLSTDQWDNNITWATSSANTLTAGSNQSATDVLSPAWSQSIYYSRYRVQAWASEPDQDKSSVAEDGSLLYTGQVIVHRREWIEHRLHMDWGATESSDSEELSAKVWVETSVDLTESQTYSITRILQGHRTDAVDVGSEDAWDTIDTTTGATNLTLTATRLGTGENVSSFSILTWPSLPSDENYDRYRLKVEFTEPMQNLTSDPKNRVADNGDTIDTHLTVERTEWILETLHIKVPQRADPDAPVDIRFWVNTSADIDRSRHYFVDFEGWAYNTTSGQWVQDWTLTDQQVTLTASTGTGDTSSATGTATWTLPKSGHDDRYTVNASFTEQLPDAGWGGGDRGNEATEDTFIRTSRDFNQTDLVWAQVPKIHRFEVDGGGDPTDQSAYYWPGDTVNAYSEIQYEFGSDYEDYQYNGAESVRYRFFDPTNTKRGDVNITLEATGLTQTQFTLPDDAAYGVWDVNVTYFHDSDTITDQGTATFVVKPRMEYINTTQYGNQSANINEGSFQVEATFVNDNMGTDPSEAHNATLTYVNDDAGTTGTTTNLTPATDARRVNYTLTTPSDVRGGDGTINVSFSVDITFRSTPVTMQTYTGDGGSPEEALIHIVSVYHPTRNIDFARTHDNATSASGSTSSPGHSGEAANGDLWYSDDSDASEASDHFTDTADSKAQGFGGNQSDDSRSTGNRDTWPTSGTTGGTLWADSDGGTNDTNGGTNFTSDTAATGMEGSNGTDSSGASSGSVPDDAPLAGRGSANQTAVDSSSATSIAVPDELVTDQFNPTNSSDSSTGTGSQADSLDTSVGHGSGSGDSGTGPENTPETLASGSGASRPSDDSSATEGDLPGSPDDLEDQADEDAGVGDEVQVLNITVPSSVTVGEEFRVWVGISGDVGTSWSGACSLGVWGHRADLDPGNSGSTDAAHWEQLGGPQVTLPAPWSWNKAVGGVWRENNAVNGDPAPAPKDITIHATDHRYNSFAIKQVCEDADEGVTSHPEFWVTNIVDRRDWLLHTLEINSVSDATGQEKILGRLRMTIDNETYVDENYTVNEAYLDYYREDTGTWVNAHYAGGLNFTYFELTAGAGKNRSHDAGEGRDFEFDFSEMEPIPADVEQYVYKWGIRVGVAEDSGQQGTIDSTAADDGSTMVTGRVEVLRKEWITHTIESRNVPNATGGGIDLQARVVLDADTLVQETIRLKPQVAVFWGHNNTWSGASDAGSGVDCVVSVDASDALADACDWVNLTVSDPLSGRADAQHITGFMVRTVGTEPNGDRHAYAENGSTIRTGWVQVNRTEWITHVGELNNVDSSTGDEAISGQFRIYLDADTVVEENFTNVQVHAQMYDLQRGEWVVGQDFTESLSSSLFTVEVDGDADADYSHAPGSGASFTVSTPIPAGLRSNVSKWRVWAEFTEESHGRAWQAENGDTIVTDYIVVERREWIDHTAHLDDVYTSVTGDPTDKESRFEFWVESDVDSPVSQQFNFTVHVQGQLASDSSWTGDIWTSSPASVSITDTGGPGDTVSNVYNSSQLGANLSLPADPDHKAWRVYVTVEEWKNRHNGVAEDGASFQTGYVVVNRKEWIQHTLNMSVAAESADSFLDVAVWMELDQDGPIAESYNINVQVDAYNLSTDQWDNNVSWDQATGVSLTAGTNQSDTSVVTVSWSQSIYYSRYRVQASTSEPDQDKSSIAEDGSALASGQVVVHRREWIEHRLHMDWGATESSDSEELSAKVWVETSVDLTESQTYSITRILQGHRTDSGDPGGGDVWDTIDTTTGAANLTITATRLGAGENVSSFSILTWPSLPSDENYDRYRLKVEFTEPAQNLTSDPKNRVADNGDTIDTHLTVERTEWILETLHIKVPQRTDPAVALPVDVWITTDYDIDAERTYTIDLEGHAYNTTSGQWVLDWSEQVALTISADENSGDTTSNTATATWNLPKNGHDDRYTVNASFTEQLPDAGWGGGPNGNEATEDTFIRTSRDLNQTDLEFNVAPKVKRVQDGAGPLDTSTYYFPGENITLWGEVRYEFGAEYKDYNTGATEDLNFHLVGPDGTTKDTLVDSVDASGFATVRSELPATAQFGVWEVHGQYSHGGDTAWNNTTAQFVVKPVIDKMITKLDTIKATAYNGNETIQLEAHFLNEIHTTDTDINTTLHYNDTNWAKRTLEVNNYVKNNTVAEVELTVPSFVADRPGSLQVNMTHSALYAPDGGSGQMITLSTRNGDELSTVRAQVDLYGSGAPPPEGPGGDVVSFQFINGRTSVNMSLDPSSAASGQDWLVDSHDTTSSYIEFDDNASDVNVVVYFDTNNLTASADAFGDSSQAINLISGTDYITQLNPQPTAGTWYNGSDYVNWDTYGADQPELWLFFDDGHQNGTVGDTPADMLPENSAAATAANDDVEGLHSPAMISTKTASGLHQVVPSSFPSATALVWSDNQVADSSDYAFEVAVPYYRETTGGGDGGTAGTLESKYVQVFLRDNGEEVAVREGGATPLGDNWRVTGWDRAKMPDGELGSETNDLNLAKNIVVTLFGNRYLLHTSSTASGDEHAVLTQAVQLPETLTSPTGRLYSALAFPADAPAGDYSWQFTLKVAKWGAEDTGDTSPDEVQYP